MGAIVELIGILTRLVQSVENRPLAEDLLRIQRLVATIQTEQATLAENNLKLSTENAGLKEKVRALEQQDVRQQAEKDLFVERCGAFFKRKPDRGYHDAVYCPRCKSPMASTSQDKPFTCGACGITVNFNPSNLFRIVRDLPAWEPAAKRAPENIRTGLWAR
jgi:ribosomal protein S27AE